jgi:Lysophospholipase L1 and related esterases
VKPLALAAAAVFAVVTTKAAPASLWEEFPLRREEPVLLTRPAPDAPPEAELLFAPARLVRIQSSDTTHQLTPGDFRIEGRKLVYTGSAAVPAPDESGLFPAEKTARSIGRHVDGVRHLLFSEGRYFHDLQLRVDYETDERWTPPEHPAPPPRGGLPRLARLADEGRQITVVLLGDSISAGANAVAHPPYIVRFVEHLRSRAAGKVTLHNLAKGGKSTPWGVEQAPEGAALRPDLFIVAFGMNDASGRYPQDKYKENIRRMIAIVRETNPDVECAVVSGMNANPVWHLARPGLHRAYHEELESLEAEGVAFCDVLTPWDHLVSRKGFHSLTGNGVNHPNDFGHRLYAEVLIRRLLP